MDALLGATPWQAVERCRNSRAPSAQSLEAGVEMRLPLVVKESLPEPSLADELVFFVFRLGWVAVVQQEVVMLVTQKDS